MYAHHLKAHEKETYFICKGSCCSNLKTKEKGYPLSSITKVLAIQERN